MKFGLSDDTIRQIHSVLARHPQVQRAIVYGSRAKGNYRNGSDIDLTLVGGADLDRRVLYAIDDELDDLLLPYTIDLSVFHALRDEELLAHIRRVGQIFYDQAQVASVV